MIVLHILGWALAFFLAFCLFSVLVQEIDAAMPAIHAVGRVLARLIGAVWWVIEKLIYVVTWEWLFHNRRDRT